jgi:hypothetical protein
MPCFGPLNVAEATCQPATLPRVSEANRRTCARPSNGIVVSFVGFCSTIRGPGGARGGPYRKGPLEGRSLS